jgi:hypothetical protein
MHEGLIAPSPRQAALWIVVDPLCRHIDWFAYFLMLAPIVGPRGYGLFVLAFSGIALAEALLAASAVQVLVDLERVEERHWSTALIAVGTTGAVMSLVLYAAAGHIAPMLDDASLGDIFRSLTVLPLLGALAVVPTARLRRQARAAPFAAATLSGLAAGGGAAVTLAWAGAGPWSLVAQILMQRFIEGAVLWLIAGGNVGLGCSRRHFAELTAGLDLRALVAVWPELGRHGPCLLVGLTLGPVAAGLYMLAARIAEALGDIALALARPRSMVSPTDIAHYAGAIVYTAALGSAAVTIVLPWALDARWWAECQPARSWPYPSSRLRCGICEMGPQNMRPARRVGRRRRPWPVCWRSRSPRPLASSRWRGRSWPRPWRLGWSVCGRRCGGSDEAGARSSPRRRRLARSPAPLPQACCCLC